MVNAAAAILEMGTGITWKRKWVYFALLSNEHIFLYMIIAVMSKAVWSTMNATWERRAHKSSLHVLGAVHQGWCKYTLEPSHKYETACSMHF